MEGVILGRWPTKPSPVQEPHQEDIPWPHKACSWEVEHNQILREQKWTKNSIGYKWLYPTCRITYFWKGIKYNHLSYCFITNLQGFSFKLKRYPIYVSWAQMKNIQSTRVSVDTFGFGETTWLNQRCYHAPLHLVLSGCTSLQSKWSACGTLESSGNSELVHREVLQWKGWNILHIL